MSPTPTIGIVGAGPAGIAAALAAAERGARVTLFDTNERIGRKLLVTGNGRCNLSNTNASPAAYTCEDQALLEPLFAEHDPAWLLEKMAQWGILTHATADGWCYPLSDSAASVVSLLEAALDEAGVIFCPNTQVMGLQPQSEGFTLFTPDRNAQYAFERVILCPGGKAYPALGSRGSLLSELARLGHTIHEVRPALAPIQVDYGIVKALLGVRLDVNLSIWRDDQQLAAEYGNMIFSRYGLNGPAAMNLSHHVTANQGANLRAVIDLLPDQSDEFENYVLSRAHTPLPLATMLLTALPPRVPPLILQLEGLDETVPMSALTPRQLRRTLRRLHNLTLPITGVGSFKQAQLSSGGVPLSEMDPATYTSQRVTHLYLAGEILDVIGPCGGYNLQFCFASGALAGESAALTA